MDIVKKYQLTSKNWPGAITCLIYDVHGKLLGIEFNVESELDFREGVLARIPLDYLGLRKAFDKKTISFKDISELDLSFQNFWNKYGVKIGAKKRVERKWSTLSDHEKMLALDHIAKYRKFCDHKGIERCFPETYLNQARWENILP